MPLNCEDVGEIDTGLELEPFVAYRWPLLTGGELLFWLCSSGFADDTGGGGASPPLALNTAIVAAGLWTPARMSVTECEEGQYGCPRNEVWPGGDSWQWLAATFIELCACPVE